MQVMRAARVVNDPPPQQNAVPPAHPSQDSNMRTACQERPKLRKILGENSAPDEVRDGKAQVASE